MYEYIKGEIKECTPTYIISESCGVGYFINISLFTFSQLNEKKESLVYIHEVIREDAYILYGFAGRPERELFRQLISVSGVGANTARMMLSSLTPLELQSAIVIGEVNLLKSIKGIGAKTAERIIVDLKDKLGKTDVEQEILMIKDNTIKDEALSALVNLGFVKSQADKAIAKILKDDMDIGVESLIKEALKRL